MIKTYGLDWLELDFDLAADLALVCLSEYKKDFDFEIDKLILPAYLNEKLIHFIAGLFEQQDPFPSFEEFKAPEKARKARTFTEEEKQKLLEKAKNIKNKFSGGANETI